MEKEYKGTIIEESLTDNRILNNIDIISARISEDENSLDRWHLYNVMVNKEDIDVLSKYIKEGKWYMHFWKDDDVIAIFKNEVFEFKYSNKETWKDAVEHGLSVGIPKEQLDFVIDKTF